MGPEPITYTIQEFKSQAVSTEMEAPGADVFGAPTDVPDTDNEFSPPSDAFIFEPPAKVDVSSRHPAPQNRVNLDRMLVSTLFTASMSSIVLDNGDQEAGQAAQQEKQQPQRRLASIHGGSIKLDVKQWPLCGNPDAKYVFVEMFDYSCPHCRRTHQQAIKPAQQRFGDQLAVLALPLPLNTNCNNQITQTGPKFLESCEIAKLAVAVWRIDPEKFTEFHNWMFEGEAKTYAEAKAKAESLVDTEKLNREFNSNVVSGYVAKHVEIYGRVGKGDVPKLMFSTTSIVGEYTSADGLVDMVQRQGPLSE